MSTRLIRSPILRWRYPVLVSLSAVAAYAMRLQNPVRRSDWMYFAKGSLLLLGSHPPRLQAPGGLNLYANYPDVQIGPLTLLIVAPVRFLLGVAGSRLAAVVFLTLLAPMILWLLEQAAQREDDTERDVLQRQLFVLVAGAIVVAQWAWLGSRFAHIDDALVLLFASVAVWGSARRRPVVVGVAIALAVAAKPWGILLLPIPLVFQGRERWKSFAVSIIGIGAAWLPFVFADADTLSAAKPTIITFPGSVLHLLGVDVGASPGWVRPAQMGLAVLLGVLLVRRGGWYGVPLLGIGVRLLLEPAIWPYFTSGLLVAAFAWELLRSRRPVPALTFVLFVLFELPTRVDQINAKDAGAVLRFTGCVLAITLVIIGLRDDKNGAQPKARRAPALPRRPHP